MLGLTRNNFPSVKGGGRKERKEREEGRNERGKRSREEIKENKGGLAGGERRGESGFGEDCR